ncbi:M56 family metallopeptidase [Rubritalea tangerina]|uniref:M56 family metallopeptidase n=1 Tax=Rubritalea tangerina TaxID=430798 RepID=A0ABW4Z875_9BACT
MQLITLSLLLTLAANALSFWLGKKNPAKASLLSAGLMSLILIAPILLLLPKWQVSIASDNVDNLHSLAPHSISILPFLSVWALGLIILLMRHIKQWRTLSHWLTQATPGDEPKWQLILARCSKQLDITNPPSLVFSTQVSSPIVTGPLKPTILLPTHARTWDPATLEMVLLHEMSHIKRHDLWITQIAQITCILHWMNPLIWILKKRLRHQTEFAVDASVIARGADAKSYINALCNVAESISNNKSLPVPALAMADQASLKNRVHRLLNNQKAPSSLLVISLLALSVCSTFALSIIRPQQSLPNPTNQSDANHHSAQEIQWRHTANPFPAD